MGNKLKSLFEEMQENEVLQDRISGELTWHGKSIVWSYKIENEINYDEDEYNDIDENDFDINDSISIEEILTCTYEEDLEEIEDNIREHVIFDELKFTEPKIKENMISFKITL
jgi:hypothetical protein